MKPRQAKWSPEQLVVVSAAPVAWGGSLLPETSAIQLRNLQRSYSFVPSLPLSSFNPSWLLRFASCVKTFGSVCSSSSIKLHEANKVIFIAHTHRHKVHTYTWHSHTHTPPALYIVCSCLLIWEYFRSDFLLFCFARCFFGSVTGGIQREKGGVVVQFVNKLRGGKRGGACVCVGVTAIHTDWKFTPSPYINFAISSWRRQQQCLSCQSPMTLRPQSAWLFSIYTHTHTHTDA